MHYAACGYSGLCQHFSVVTDVNISLQQRVGFIDPRRDSLSQPSGAGPLSGDPFGNGPVECVLNGLSLLTWHKRPRRGPDNRLEIESNAHLY